MREPTEREVLEVMDALLGFYSKELQRSDDPADKLTLRQVRLEAEKACRAFLSVSNEAKGPQWKRVLSNDLPDGAPVEAGTTLYAFDKFPGHWEYELPPLPSSTATEERSKGD